MARTKFMTRIFSAQDNEESLVLDQISSDIDKALENDGLETQEYNIDVLSPSQVEVHDKVNDEDTIIDIADGEFSMRAKTYSDIKNAEEFRKYAHTVMKEAHGDDYSEEATDKVVDDLIKDNPDADWGELIGRLTSGFSKKTFSEKKNNLKNFSEVAQKFFSEVTYAIIEDTGDPSVKFIKKGLSSKDADDLLSELRSKNPDIKYRKIKGEKVKDFKLNSQKSFSEGETEYRTAGLVKIDGEATTLYFRVNANSKTEAKSKFVDIAEKQGKSIDVLKSRAFILPKEQDSYDNYVESIEDECSELRHKFF